MSSSSSSPFEDDERFDGLYMNVAQTAQGIDPLLDSVFGFLRRKTDFFAGPPGSEDGKGTELAIAKVQQVMEKHVKRYQAERAKSAKKKATTTNPTSTSKKPKSSSPAAQTKKEEDDVIEMGTDGNFDVSAASPASPEKVATPAAPAATAPTKEIETTRAPAAAESSNDEEGDESEKKTNPPVGNGGTVPGKYVWTQTLSEVTVNIPVPQNTRGRDLNVVIGKKTLKVGLRGGNLIIEEAPLCKPIIVDDSFWTVEDGNRLVINLQKSNQMEWWDCVVQGDPKIDVKTIQPENSSLGDLDGETRKTVEKMMLDQRQKALGLPTSEEQQKLDVLQRFQKEHPELDFSNVKIT